MSVGKWASNNEHHNYMNHPVTGGLHLGRPLSQKENLPYKTCSIEL